MYVLLKKMSSITVKLLSVLLEGNSGNHCRFVDCSIRLEGYSEVTVLLECLSLT